MSWRLLILVLGPALLALLAACTGEPVKGPPESSGIEGIVLLCPQCPVEREGSPCPDEPFQAATVDVYTADRKQKVATFTSDAAGRFRVGLLPGDYYLNPLPPDPGSPLPAGFAQTVTVQQMKWTQVTLQYDTGIR